MHALHILQTDTNPPQASQMPSRLSRQILYHNTSQHHDLRFDLVQNAVVGEVQAVCYVLGYPFWGWAPSVPHFASWSNGSGLRIGVERAGGMEINLPKSLCAASLLTVPALFSLYISSSQFCPRSRFSGPDCQCSLHDDVSPTSSRPYLSSTFAALRPQPRRGKLRSESKPIFGLTHREKEYSLSSSRSLSPICHTASRGLQTPTIAVSLTKVSLSRRISALRKSDVLYSDLAMR